MKRRNAFCQLTSAAIVAIGLTILWAIIESWGWRLSGDLLGHGGRSSQESLVVTYEGEPLIVTNIGGSSTHRAYRKLDGTVVEFENQGSLYSGRLDVETRSPGLIKYPVTWKARLRNASDVANPPVYWHFIRDCQLRGHAYFVGYDSVSKRIVGFIGRQGYRASLPPEDEWFDVGSGFFHRNPRNYASVVGMRSADSFNDWRYMRVSDSRYPPEWIGFLIDGDRLLRIDFRQRTVSLFEETPGASALAFGREPRAPSRGETAASDVDPEPTGVAETDAEEDYRPKTVLRFLVRYPDRVVVWDMKNQTSQEFPLPSSLHGASIDAYSIGNGQLLVRYLKGYWERGSWYQLIWVDVAGNELRQELIKLVGWKPDSERKRARDDAWAAPLPAYWIYRLFARRPFELLQDREAPSYLAALSRIWRASLPSIAVLTLLAAIATTVERRWHHRYARPNASWWSAFVLLFSVPGLIAYRLFHECPPLAQCSECGETVPRDRDACTQCEKTFAEPALLGTEILA